LHSTVLTAPVSNRAINPFVDFVRNVDGVITLAGAESAQSPVLQLVSLGAINGLEISQSD
jgi:hypothetical protein